MIHVLLSAIGLSSGVLAADFPKAQYDLQLDQYAIGTQDYQFPSGLRILFQEDHTQPIVSITNWLDRGSVYDGKNAEGESTEGIAHAVEHLAFRAKHGDLPKNWDVINQLGGVLNASTSREWTNYMTVAPVDAAVPLMRIEALRLEDAIATVTEEDVEAEKSIVRNELRMGYESGANGSAAVRTAFVHLPKLLYPEGHLYRNSTIGSHDSISNISLADIRRYVDENYRPEYSTIAVVGDFTLEGGLGMAMTFEAFEGVEHLLMAPEDAEAYEALTDPEERRAFLEEWVPRLAEYIRTEGAEPPKPRVDCSKRVEPPDLQDDTVMKIKGMVDKTTAVAAWTLPSGYCADDVNMNIAANLLQNYIIRTVDSSYNPLTQESSVDGVGCFVDADRRGSVLVCFVEAGELGNMNADRTLDRVADALYMQTQPMDAVFKPFLDQNLTYSRLSNMSSILNMTDNVASLYGRSFFVSQHAHYTGSAQFFSDAIRDSNQMSFDAAKALAAKYITRDRMARLVIEPMDEEERERLEASATEADKDNDVAGSHRAKDDRSRQLFNTEDLTPEAIAAVTVVPDLERANRFTLDNGLEVVLMNHGEAPLVKVGIEVDGSNAVAPKWGLDSLANSLHFNGSKTNRDFTQNPLAIAGMAYMSGNSAYASGSSGNLGALLHKLRSNINEVEWQMADKAGDIRSWKRSAKANGKKPENWAERLRYERLFEGHPYGKWMASADYDAYKELTTQEIKDWYATKWQPQNARLVVVGKIADMELAEKQVRDYFDSWSYSGTGEASTVEPPPAPTEAPDRQVLLFDKPIATQSKLQVSCQLDYSGRQDLPRTQVMGEYFTFLAFERLREEAGLTYGAYAFPRGFWGNTRELILASVIQNSGVGFGVKTFFDIIEEGATGEIDEGDVRTNAWNVGRTSVTNLQSGDQMLSALLAPGRGNLEAYAEYPAQLGSVSVADIQAALKPCQGHEIVTIVGPVDEAKPQLDELGIAYEVVDWEGLYEAGLTKKEKKSYRKAKEKEAKAADDA